MTLDPVLNLALLMLAALLAARLLWRGRRAGLGINLLFAVGTHLIVLGLLLGPVTGVLSREDVSALSPFLVLGLGWTGMLVGAQLDLVQFRRFPPRLAATPFLEGTVAFGVAIAAAALLFLLVGGASPAWAPTGPAVLTLAAITAVSTPAVVTVVANASGARGPLTRYLMYVASLDGLVGIVAVAFVFAFHHPSRQYPWDIDAPWVWLLVSLLAGVLVGLLFLSLTRAKPSPDELVLFLGGTILFGSGVAYALNLSPLVVGLVGGVVIANLSPVRRRVYAQLVAWEKPMYGFFLIIAGAMLRPPGWAVVPLLLVLLAVRAGARWVGGWLTRRVAPPVQGAPPGVGLGLFAQGGLALALAIGYAVNYRQHPQGMVDTVVAAVVLSVAISELVGPFLLRSVLVRAGEAVPGGAPAAG